MLRRMLVRMFRSERCRLRTDQRAQKEHYKQGSNCAVRVEHCAYYTRAQCTYHVQPNSIW